MKKVKKTTFHILNNLNDSYKLRQSILFFIDMMLIYLACITTIYTIWDFNMNKLYLYAINENILIYYISIIPMFYIFKFYKSLWRYASIEELINVVLASSSSMIILHSIFKYLLHIELSNGFYILNAFMIIFFTGGLRFAYRIVRRLKLKLEINSNTSNVLIVGGGRGGELVIKELINNPELNKKPIGIIDDQKSKLNKVIQGVPIIGTTEDIQAIVKSKSVEEIIIAIPSLRTGQKKKLIEICQKTKCKLKIVPGVYELIDGKVDIKKIRDIEIEDLLGRDCVKMDLEDISKFICDKIVFVSGGGGSIGSELCRQIAKFTPKKLVIFDIYENSVYDLQQELFRTYKDRLDVDVLIGSVRDKKRVENIFKKYNPEIVFHAAAHKHVPLMENSPCEAIKNNVFGTLNLASLSDKYSVGRFVLISTDKAVNPTNVMGATKRIAEMIIQSLDKESKTDFACVRFGNVLGSNGSVIPLFKKQIEKGGPVTVTHPDIIRYFMTIPEAVQLVLQAGAMANGGEIFILDMGEPVKIVDLARNLISLSGFDPDVDMKIEFTGLRKGEKLYEELLTAEEGIIATKHEKIFIGKAVDVDIDALNEDLGILKNIVKNENIELLEVLLKRLVPTYNKGNGREEVSVSVN